MNRQNFDAKPKKRGPVFLSENRAINLATTYSRGTYRPTTIGCSGLNGRVRDGNGWAPGIWSPESESPRGEKSNKSLGQHAARRQKKPLRTARLHKPSKVISTSKLNALPRLHSWPINRVVCPDLAPYCYGL